MPHAPVCGHAALAVCSPPPDAGLGEAKMSASMIFRLTEMTRMSPSIGTSSLEGFESLGRERDFGKSGSYKRRDRSDEGGSGIKAPKHLA